MRVSSCSKQTFCRKGATQMGRICDMSFDTKGIPRRVFCLRPGPFREELKAGKKSACHLYEAGGHFREPDAAFYRETQRLARALLESLPACAEIYFPESCPLVPIEQATALAGWEKNDEQQVFTGGQPGYRKVLLWSGAGGPRWTDQNACELWTGGMSADYHGSPAWADGFVASGCEAAEEKAREETQISLLCDDVHGVWTILTERSCPWAELEKRLRLFCRRLSASLLIQYDT